MTKFFVPSGVDVDRVLVIVRHGVTDWNLEERYQGQLDVPLNSVGRLQAEALRRHLTGIAFDAVYSSPLVRAYETANIICGNAPITRDPRLAEIHHGAWQGKTRQELGALRHSHWNNDGESMEQLRLRVADFLRTMNGETILCVTHGVVIQIIRSILLNNPDPQPDDDVPSNGSVHMFSFRNDKVLEYECKDVQ